MGFKARSLAPSIDKVLSDYRSWYLAYYECDDQDPFRALKPLTSGGLSAFEDTVGPQPESYRWLLRELGPGPLSIASSDEPVDFTLLSPKHVKRVRRDVLGCIDPELIPLARERQGLEAERLLPFLVDRDWNQWALLGNQHPADERVFLFSHEQEQYDDRDLFKAQGSLADYFTRLFDQARQLYSPWYLWTCWK